ncbi:hypothetical protein HQ489_01335 [Candidatus Woesearchaeota archaeon]|nr:hypothetical protein [Candidatus Woesearchaeota archaeon]
MKTTIVILLILTIFLASCTSEIPSEKVCKVDADCVPNKCCGADDGVNIDGGPDCQGILCAAVCNPDTIDCGNGQIKCVNKACTAVFNNA